VSGRQNHDVYAYMCTFFLVVAFHDARFLSGLYGRFSYIVSQKQPRQTLTSCSEAHQKHQTRMQCGDQPIIHPTTDPNTRQGGPTAPASTQRGGVDLRSRSARKHGRRLQPRSAPNPEAPRRSRDPQSKIEAQSHPQVVVLASIDLRSQHGRLVSARVSASLRKGVQGSCNRAASQAAGRAYRIVLQRSRPRRGGERGLERPPKAEIL
jgi:hypothetical protein